MKRINVIVSDEAKKIVLGFQEKKNISTLDETMDKFILEKKQ